MQVVDAFHIHHPQVVIENVDCDMCSHHVHHSGHFTGDQYHMHPCLLCQMANYEFALPLNTLINNVKQVVRKIETVLAQHKLATFTSSRSSRAPPAI